MIKIIYILLLQQWPKKKKKKKKNWKWSFFPCKVDVSCFDAFYSFFLILGFKKKNSEMVSKIFL